MWLTRISVKYPVFTIMMMFCLMVLGLASWQRMGVEEFPDVDFPFVVVYTNYPGASPETVESEITKKNGRPNQYDFRSKTSNFSI